MAQIRLSSEKWFIERSVDKIKHVGIENIHKLENSIEENKDIILKMPNNFLSLI